MDYRKQLKSIDQSTEMSVKLIHEDLKKIPLSKLKPAHVKKKDELGVMIKN